MSCNVMNVSEKKLCNIDWSLVWLALGVNWLRNKG